MTADHQKSSVASFAVSSGDAGKLGLSSTLDTLPKKPLKRNKYALAISILASMTSVLLGYDCGVMSGATQFIQEDLIITDVQVELLVGTINIYSLVGSAVAGRTSDWVGRRYTIVFASTIFFLGAILMGFATNYAFLMVGRFVAGIGVGYALMIAPVYAAEVAPASCRGFLTSFPEVFINFGVLLGYVSNFAFAKLPLTLGWRMMLGVGAVPSVLLGVGVLYMPESPRWLVLQGRLGDAKKVLDKTSDSLEESKLRLADIKEAAGVPLDCHDEIVQVQKRSQGQGVWKELLLHPTKPVLHILICGVGIHFFQQGIGIDSVVLYSPRIYEKAGIKNTSDKLLATIAVGVSKTFFILITTFFVDRFGRRPLLLTSCAGVALSMFALGTSLTIIDRNPDGNIKGLLIFAVILTMAIVGFFSMGLGPIAWVYSSEIFPLKLRAQGCSMGVAMNRFMSGVILMSFISLYKAITIGGAFFLFGGITTVAFIFFYTLFPETQGRTLEEMEELFGTFFSWRTRMKELDAKKKTGSEAT
uniref:Polyol transporter n=1 Tax=Plantago major TaxID=29818 RepID=Q70W28_PLAMJ|nr:polyol transporter [Plantago major]CAR82415.1 polyol transporter [Plantago major]